MTIFGCAGCGAELTVPGNRYGSWNLRWEAAFGLTLAHLLAASDGARLVVGDPRLDVYLTRSFAALTPADGPSRTVVLEAPGDVVLSPADPVTGRVPDGRTPLAAEVWTYLTTPAILREDAWDEFRPQVPAWFEPDMEVFRNVLARSPHVGEPWLRAVYDRTMPRYLAEAVATTGT